MIFGLTEETPFFNRDLYKRVYNGDRIVLNNFSADDRIGPGACFEKVTMSSSQRVVGPFNANRQSRIFQST